MKYFVVLFSFLALALTFNLRVYSPTEALFERAPANEPCAQLVQHFIHPKTFKLENRPGSLFSYDNSLIQRVDELVAPEIDLSLFFQSFEKTNQKAPTLRDAMKYIIERKMAVLSKYDVLIADLEKRNKSEHFNLPVLIEELKKSRDKLSHFKSLEQLDLELRTSYQNDKTALMNLDEKIELKDNGHYVLFEDYYTYLKNKLGLSNFQGEYGELTALAAANEKIIARGLTFKESELNSKNYANQISKAVDELEKKLSHKTEEELVSLVKKHGQGLLRMAQDYIDTVGASPLSKETLVKKIMSMVRSKEIDVVFIDSKGKFVWSEVKAYNEKITKETIAKSSHNGKKTIYEQLIEHQALAEILEIKNVRFRFISPLSPVDEEARKMISSLGYEVVFAK